MRIISYKRNRETDLTLNTHAVEKNPFAKFPVFCSDRPRDSSDFPIAGFMVGRLAL